MPTTNIALEYAVFTAVRMWVFSAGGDGNGLVISPRWKELADHFEKWEKEIGQWFIGRYDAQYATEFFREQESVIFTGSREGLSESAGSDITIEIP